MNPAYNILAIILFIFFACISSNKIKHDITKTPFDQYIGKKVKLIQPANINGYGYGCDVVVYFTDGSKLILSCYKYKMKACQ